MAQVDSRTRGDVDHLLGRALAAWKKLPNVEREIDAWDLTDQIVFVEEWPLEEMRLQRLAEYVRADQLDGAQQAEYARLLAIVARNRPIITRLINA